MLFWCHSLISYAVYSESDESTRLRQGPSFNSPCRRQADKELRAYGVAEMLTGEERRDNNLSQLSAVEVASTSFWMFNFTPPSELVVLFSCEHRPR